MAETPTPNPEIIEGITCYAPTLSFSEDYPAAAFEQLFRLEERHFWFRARNRIIRWAFKRYLADQERPDVLEVGCGTGFVLEGLAAEGRYELTGAEAHLAGLRFAKRRLPAVEFVQLDARSLPYASKFDAIGAFDVIEHIEEDEEVLASMHRALKPNGLVFLTVPQHMWLWSAPDDEAFHKRRYTRRELVSKLEAARFDALYCTSFVTLLLPVMAAVRWAKRGTSVKDAIGAELQISPLANIICGWAMRIDEIAIRTGMSLPIGGSLMVVARKSAVRGTYQRGNC